MTTTDMRMMMRMMNGGLLVLAAALAMSQPVRAGEAPRLVLQMVRGQASGPLKDGARLGKLLLASRAEHSGFVLKGEPDDGEDVSQAGHYTLRGKENATHRLRVRLVTSALPAAADGESLLLNTAATQVRVDVVADGDQTVAGDRYTLNVSAALREENGP